jgi:hypothetical protein
MLSALWQADVNELWVDKLNTKASELNPLDAFGSHVGGISPHFRFVYISRRRPENYLLRTSLTSLYSPVYLR